MSEPSIDTLRADGWGNCPQCGYFYKQSVLQLCPACRHDHRQPITYNQPNYESPSLG